VLVVLSVMCALAATPPRAGQPGHVGLGVGMGTAVAGASIKWLPAHDHAFQVLVGVSPGGTRYGYSYGPLAAELDYLYEMPVIADLDPVLIRWTLGAGGTIVTDTPLFLGVQAIAGLEFDFVDAPVDFVIEYRPGFDIFLGQNGGVGFNPFWAGAHVRVWL
jgi:hypothetical protein